MPIQYEIDHERRLVRARVSGVLTDDDIFGYQRDAWSRPEVAGYDELVDMSAVIRIALPSIQRMKDLARLSAEMDAHGHPSRFAIVAPGDIAFMLGRLYKVFRGLASGTKRVGVFRTEAEADEFLRRPAEPGAGPGELRAPISPDGHEKDKFPG
jgi:hypothetical protein